MYSSEFCKIYDKYGWDYFSITMGNAIIEYLKATNNILNEKQRFEDKIYFICQKK